MKKALEAFNRKNHWENIYQTKEQTEVSWYQAIPNTSLEFFRQFDLPTNSKIIDIGGGESLLVDHLLDMGYQDITVLDISEFSLERAKKRLGNRAENVKWIIADAATFKPTEKYDFWHDRAAFHFLTREQEISAYIDAASGGINPSGVLMMGTFSEQGPQKCCGLNIQQYSENSMASRLEQYFEKMECKEVEHITPSGTIQNYIFCSFKKL